LTKKIIKLYKKEKEKEKEKDNIHMGMS